MPTSTEIIAAANPKDLTEALLTSINAIAGTSGTVVVGKAADGAAASGNPVQVAGVDGSGNVQALAADTSGRVQVIGGAADGATAVGNPVPVAGVDVGGLAQSLLVDSTGRIQVSGAAADGAAAAGNPVQVGGVDGSGNAQAALVDTSGRFQIVGAAADSGALAGINPIMVGMVNGSNIQSLRSSNGDGVVGGLLVANGGYLWNGTNFDRTRSAAILDSNLSVGLLAAHDTMVDDSNGTLTSVNAKSQYRARVVSATNTATALTIDLRNMHDTLGIHGVCSAGTAALTVEISADNTNFITIDSIAAAATQIKQYTATTVGATVALSPLAFRYVRVTMGSAGVGNTTTLTVGAK